MELVTLKIETRGEVLYSNLKEFRESVKMALSSINQKPETDEDFGKAELDVKALKNAESVVEQAKKEALAQAEDLQKLFAALDESKGEISAARLGLEKVIDKRKKEIRANLVDKAKDRLDCASHLRSRYDDLIESSIKGKRTIRSIQEGLDVAVACANKSIAETKKVIDEFVAEYGEDMVMDREELEIKRADVVGVELRRRLEVKRAAEEKKRLEEEARIAREAEKAAREEAAARDLPPALPTLPEPPPNVSFVGTVSKKKTVQETEEQELAGFCARVVSVFGGLRAAREALKHPGNIELVNEFASSVNEAFAKLKKGGSAQ
ncbi:hypothetical protein QET40_06745 [Akkermansia sp. N21169]|uniref:hypothetical protein n=1 Tax=Akkermansia sp. N21169 TaxID=3040765 RepID=UPI00244EE11A|nr:hypothetical protein [Akkermansia sp. N21169]MDH3068812.1 hypothetical protein [Akkermansia sp. N21169]